MKCKRYMLFKIGKARYTVLLLGLCVTLMVGGVSAQVAESFKKPVVIEDEIAVYFSPGGGAADAVIHLIDASRKSVQMEAYFLTHDKIIDALVRAQERGVKVDIVWDDEGIAKSVSDRRKLRRAGITVYILKKEEVIMHNKVLILDSKVLVTGSMNFTWSADSRNVENTLIIRNKPRIIAAYEKQHKRLQGISKKYETQ